jgi:hypothetical protein
MSFSAACKPCASSRYRSRMRQDNPDFTVHMRVIRRIREAPLAKAVTKKEWAAVQVTNRRPNTYKRSSVSCKACPHPDGRLWPWPRLQSCMRRLWSYRSTSSPGSGRPWWRYSTRPNQDHHQEPEWSMLAWLPWSWLTERPMEQGPQQREPQEPGRV